MTERLVIVGSGGFGREVLCLVRDLNRFRRERGLAEPWEFLGFLAADCPDSAMLGRLGATYLGSDRDRELIGSLGECHFVSAVGNGAVRRSIYDRMVALGLSPATLLDPTCIVGPDVLFGDGVVVGARAILTTNIRIGRGCVVDRGSQIGHDTRLAEFVTLAPGVVLSGNVIVGSEAYLGTMSSTVQGVAVGEGALVGAGGVVTRDIPAGATAVGVPARPIPRGSD